MGEAQVSPTLSPVKAIRELDCPEEMGVVWEHCSQGCESQTLDQGKGCLDSQGQHYAFISK